MGERVRRDGPRMLVERGLVTEDDEVRSLASAPLSQLRLGGTAAKSSQPSPRRGEGSRRSVTVNLAESPLGWLKARGMVSGRQFDAGERLRADWETAGLAPRVTMCWDSGAAPSRGRRGPSEGIDPTLAQISAKRRFSAAVDAVGPGLSDVLWRVVCAGEGLSGAEKSLGWPARAGKLVLGLALDRLADFYRIG